MIIFVIALALISALSVNKIDSYESFFDKKTTTTINGIFVILIFLSHSTQYISVPNNALDQLYLSFRRIHDQWIVTTFLLFSGYGVMTRIMLKGEAYVKAFPRNRLLKTLVNFDIAVVLYMVVNGVLGIHYSKLENLGSFIGITSIGNSNWYIFTILVLYIFSYVAAVVYKDRTQNIILTVFFLTFINTFPICRTIQYRQTGLNSSEDVRACA